MYIVGHCVGGDAVDRDHTVANAQQVAVASWRVGKDFTWSWYGSYV
jgi:hypothetical protein